jgi:hypothetical protein
MLLPQPTPRPALAIFSFKAFTDVGRRFWPAPIAGLFSAEQ